MKGLNKEEVKDYWIKRSSIQGKETVGFCGNNLNEQDREYEEKTSFVLPWVNHQAITLDYGCGVGRWSWMFDNYIGVDLTQNLLNIAIKENPTKKYYHLKHSSLEGFKDANLSKIEQFFSSTVLQHCDDTMCDNIFHTFSEHKPTHPTFILYETSIKTGAYHNKGRTTQEYADMISKYFNIVEVKFEEHLVHGQPHTISKIITK